jgi:hypothetical protein
MINHTANASRRLAVGLALLICETGLLMASSANAAEVPGTLAALGVTVPQSAFIDDPNQGKDPFFPESKRRLPKPKADPKPTAIVASPKDLMLKGISGPPNRRFALINNLPFIAGEEGQVKTPNGPMRIRCLEVLDNAVVIMIDNDGVRRELRLRDGSQ